MGQQKFLLFLATLIVGIATVLGIQSFSQDDAKANVAAMMDDAIGIAAEAQAWAQTSAPFGGPTAATMGTFTELTNLEQIGYRVNDQGEHVTRNGSCALTAGASPVITCTNDQGNNQVKVTISGLTDADIKGEVVRLGTAAASASPGAGR